MMAALIQKHIRHYSISQIMQFLDGAIVLLGIYAFGIHRALYAIIAVYLVAKISDGIIEGMKFSKAAYIVTDHPEEISQMIMEDIGRGVTGVSAKGMYSQREKLMLFCVVNKKEIVVLKREGKRDRSQSLCDRGRCQGSIRGRLHRENIGKITQKNCRFFRISSFIFGDFVLK